MQKANLFCSITTVHIPHTTMTKEQLEQYLPLSKEIENAYIRMHEADNKCVFAISEDEIYKSIQESNEARQEAELKLDKLHNIIFNRFIPESFANNKELIFKTYIMPVVRGKSLL